VEPTTQEITMRLLRITGLLRSAGKRLGAVALGFSSAITLAALPTLVALAAPDPTALLRGTFHNWKADSSATTMLMTVHRSDWERHLQMKGWTRGDDEALVRFTAPAKDAGNATLKLANETFIYNPKLNQVVKLPASLLAQSWMGSDFSYNDLSKSEDLLTEYTHILVGTEQADGHTVYTIDALPKPGAPVVWGKQRIKVRDDNIFLEETYFDQDMHPVRAMTTEKVASLGGRDYPAVLVMRPSSEPDHWTRIETTAGSFDTSLPAYLFTRSNLQNPRD
jgi:outer membrane lipoprotein-sorting protein